MIHHLLLVLAVVLPAAQASSDSVGVFTNPGKTVVLVNERGTQSRLHDWMNAWGAAEKLQIESRDQSFNMQCARSMDAASCTFKFLPSPFNEVTAKGAKGIYLVGDLSSAPKVDIDLSFESSRGHRFLVSIANGVVTAIAVKP